MKTKKIPLSDLKVGMKIKTKDSSGIIFKEVTDVWKTKVTENDQRRLEFTNGSVIHCSKNHPIMVFVGSTIIEKKPDELIASDEIVTDSGVTYLRSCEVDNQSNDYIDITVEDTHTFFASESIDSEMILTHNSQGGVRGGAATIYYPCWHLEVEDLLVLKNNKGTDDNRVRHVDYGVQFSKLFYERLITGGDITLFSPSDVPGLYDAFFRDQDEFKEIYERAERNTRLRKKTIPAAELFSAFMEERKNTGRIYLMNVDHANDHGSFKADLAPIRMSNLCAEISQATRPLNSLDDEDGRIALCTLSAINFGNIKSPGDFKKVCELAVRGLDALLDYQKYPVLAAELHTREFRPLGIGIINLAYFLAKNGSSYQDPDLKLLDEYAEAWSYYLIRASVDLAKEKGHAERSDLSKYHDGILPIDTYKKDVDELVKPNFRMAWDELREDLKKYGIRNTTLMALMPSESSAQISNATNGIEPPRGFVSIKQSKDGVLKQVVPGYPRLKNKYDLLWDQKSPVGYLKIAAVLQKYIDQSISTNTSYNPAFYEDEKIPMSEMLQHLLFCYKYGLKTLYYFNQADGQGEIKLEEAPTEQQEDSTIEDSEVCDSCAI